MSKKRGTLFVLSGPSGVGKGTVCKALDKDALNMEISVSMTTRKPRVNEITGVSYDLWNMPDLVTMPTERQKLLF